MKSNTLLAAGYLLAAGLFLSGCARAENDRAENNRVEKERVEEVRVEEVLAEESPVEEVAVEVRAGDVTQWRGDDRSGAYPETGLLKEWPTEGPRKLWETEELGGGYSSPIAVGKYVYVTGLVRDGSERKEVLTCLDKSGKIVWQTVYGNGYSGQYPSARTTPTWRDGELYVISGSGEVVKLHAGTGKIVWQVDAKARYGGENGMWGTAESPLVDENAVYFTAGGSETTLVALSRKDGKRLWQTDSLDDKASYVSPTMIEQAEVRQIVGATTNYLFGVEPETGNLLWKLDIREELDGGRRIQRWDIIANSLVYVDGKILMSNGYDQGSLFFQLNQTGKQVKIVWKNLDLTSMHHGFVILDGHVYSTAHNEQAFTVVELATGKTTFHERIGNLNLAQIITADGLLYLYDNRRGNMILAKPDPQKGFEEISRFPIRFGTGEHWCHPIISDGILYVRRGGTMAAFDLRDGKGNRS